MFYRWHSFIDADDWVIQEKLFSEVDGGQSGGNDESNAIGLQYLACFAQLCGFNDETERFRPLKDSVFASASS